MTGFKLSEQEASRSIEVMMLSMTIFERGKDGTGDELIGTVVTTSDVKVRLRIVRRTRGWGVGIDAYIDVDGFWEAVFCNTGIATPEVIKAWYATSERAYKFNDSCSSLRRKTAIAMLKEIQSDYINRSD